MNLRDSLNQYYSTMTVADLRLLSRSGEGELSYNSIMYLDVISFQQAKGLCTVSTLADTLRITRSAVTLKVNDLERLGLVVKERSETDRRVVHLRVSPRAEQALTTYDRPFERALRKIETDFTPEQLAAFCAVLQAFSTEFEKES